VIDSSVTWYRHLGRRCRRARLVSRLDSIGGVDGFGESARSFGEREGGLEGYLSEGDSGRRAGNSIKLPLQSGPGGNMPAPKSRQGGPAAAGASLMHINPPAVERKVKFEVRIARRSPDVAATPRAHWESA